MKTVTWLDSDGHFNVWSLDNLSAKRKDEIAIEISKSNLEDTLDEGALFDFDNAGTLRDKEFIDLLQNLSSRGTLEIVEVQ